MLKIDELTKLSKGTQRNTTIQATQIADIEKQLSQLKLIEDQFEKEKGTQEKEYDALKNTVDE